MSLPSWSVTAALVGALLTSCATGSSTAVDAVGFILVGSRDDLGYNQAVWEGADSLARALPDVRVLRTEGVPEDDSALDALEALVEQGADVVFATSFGHREAALEVARRHPEVTVVHQGATPPEPGLPNYGSYFGAHAEAAYGAGILAGHHTTTGQLGFVVAFPIPATFNNVNAFTLGARSVRPDVTTQVSFTLDWCDPAAQDAAFDELVAAGVDVVAQHQDCTGTILQRARDAGVGAVGYHADGSEVAGDAWLVGAVWTWGDVYVDVVEQHVAGTFAESPYARGFVGTVRDGDNPFILTDPGPAVSAEAASSMAAALARFAVGEPVFAGPLADRDGVPRVPAGSAASQEEIDAMDWWVQGVVGDVP